MSRYSKSRVTYKNNKEYFKTTIYSQIPKSDSDIYVITQFGDRLDLLAHQFYGDVDLWWIIAISNIGKVRRDSFFIKPGLQIRIPNSKEEIIEKYKELNE